MQTTKLAAEELAEMIRDGLAEEGHEVQVHPNPETGWHVAIISANNAEDAGIRAEAIASGLRQSYDLGDLASMRTARWPLQGRLARLGNDVDLRLCRRSAERYADLPLWRSTKRT